MGHCGAPSWAGGVPRVIDDVKIWDIALTQDEVARTCNALDVDTWLESTRLPEPRTGHRVVSHDRYIYTIGGVRAGGKSTADIWVAGLSQSGLLGEWRATTSLPRPLVGFDAVVAEGHLYVIGGVDEGSPTVSIRRAKINGDGSLGEFTVSSGSDGLLRPRADHRAVFAAGHIYVVGGRFADPLGPIESAEVHYDGSLGPWRDTGRVLIDGRIAPAVVATDDLLIITGGRIGGFATEWVKIAPIRTNGTLGRWLEDDPPALRVGRSDAEIVLWGSHLILAGGTAFTLTDGIEASNLASDVNQLGPWLPVGELPSARAQFGMTRVGHHLVLVGGSTSQGNERDVFVAELIDP